MSEERFSLKQRILLALHNLCAINPNKAARSEDLAEALKVSKEEVDYILRGYEGEGYAKGFEDAYGHRRFYLTALGILRACSIFT